MYFGNLNLKHAYISLVIIFLFHTVNNIIWLEKNTLPPAWDQSSYLVRSLFIYRLLENPGINFFDDLFMITTYRPPLFYVSPFPLYFLFGTSDDIATLTNIFFLAILIFSIYGIGKNLYNERVGVLSSFILTTFTIIFGLSRQFLVDFALTAMVSLSIYLLILTNNFKNKKYSYIFGITIGLGLLTKWTYPVFIIGPLLHVSIKSFSFKEALYRLKRWPLNKFDKNKNTVETQVPEQNFLIASLLGLAVASIWYIPHIDFINLFLYTGFGEGGRHFGPSSVFSLESFLYYFVNLINYQISFFYFLMLLIAIGTFLKCESGSRILIGSWALFPYIIFTLALDKDIRFTVPLLPAVAVITARGILELENPRLKTTLIGIMLLVGSLQFFAVSYGSDKLPNSVVITSPAGKIMLFTQQSLWENNGQDVDEFWNYRVKEEDWKVNNILDVLEEQSRGNRIYKVAVISEHAWFNHMGFRYHSYQRNLPFAILDVVHFPETFTQNFSNIDFAIIKDENNANWILRKNLDSLILFLNDHKSDFSVIGKTELPDGSNAIIYMRTEVSSN